MEKNKNLDEIAKKICLFDFSNVNAENQKLYGELLQNCIVEMLGENASKLKITFDKTKSKNHAIFTDNEITLSTEILTFSKENGIRDFADAIDTIGHELEHFRQKSYPTYKKLSTEFGESFEGNYVKVFDTLGEIYPEEKKFFETFKSVYYFLSWEEMEARRAGLCSQINFGTHMLDGIQDLERTETTNENFKNYNSYVEANVLKEEQRRLKFSVFYCENSDKVLDLYDQAVNEKIFGEDKNLSEKNESILAQAQNMKMIYDKKIVSDLVKKYENKNPIFALAVMQSRDITKRNSKTS